MIRSSGMGTGTGTGGTPRCVILLAAFPVYIHITIIIIFVNIFIIYGKGCVVNTDSSFPPIASHT